MHQATVGDRPRLPLDRTLDGRWLVYGGHTIGLAASQAVRALPSLVSILGWHTADHTGPVFEGDTLGSQIALERRDPLPRGGGLSALAGLRHASRRWRGGRRT